MVGTRGGWVQWWGAKNSTVGPGTQPASMASPHRAAEPSASAGQDPWLACWRLLWVSSFQGSFVRQHSSEKEVQLLL